MNTMLFSHNGEARNGEPWGRRLWLAMMVVVLVAAALQSYGISHWPMADDEVLSLVQLGRYQLDSAMFSFPADHLPKLPRAVPVWQAFQGAALSMMPDTITGYRLPSLICAILNSTLVFLIAARWRGLWFAAAAFIMMNGSLLFIHIAQVDRFYSMPMLLLTVTLFVIWTPHGGIGGTLTAGVLGLLLVFSHNVTVAALGLAFAAAAMLFVVGRVPRLVVLRSGAAFAMAALVYLFFLRPLIAGWHTTGNPTPVLMSFAAYLGIPTVALALFGSWFALTSDKSDEPGLWWLMVLVGTLCLFQLSSFSWNPRYFVFFLPPAWFLAANALDVVVRRLPSAESAVAWYTCAVVLLAPGLISHYRDGSRHDFRQAATVLGANNQTNAPILSDDAETISYYLPDRLKPKLMVRTKATTFPPDEFFLVARMNAWTPLPQIPGRQLELISEIYTRRFDQFSHILRVYRVSAGSNE